jgi:hypothetical protein
VPGLMPVHHCSPEPVSYGVLFWVRSCVSLKAVSVQICTESEFTYRQDLTEETCPLCLEPVSHFGRMIHCFLCNDAQGPIVHPSGISPKKTIILCIGR